MMYPIPAPASDLFILSARDGLLTVHGLKRAVEILCIPAAINGKPVDTVYLPRTAETQVLRELTVENGVRRLACRFDFPRLGKVSLPEDITLMEVPTGILGTPWFFMQEEGPVYFNRWYCGTRGEVKGQLKLRSDTLGVLPGADRDAAWEHVILNRSLQYLGAHSLTRGFYPWRDFPKKLPRRITDPKSSPLALYNFGRFLPRAHYWESQGFAPVIPKFRYQNGWILEYYYCTEDALTVAGHLRVRLEDGVVLASERWDVPNSPRNLWSQDYVPTFYHRGEAYMNAALRLVRKGDPATLELIRLEQMWHRTVPFRLQQFLSACPTPANSSF